MKVKELIKKLSIMDGELEVFVRDLRGNIVEPCNGVSYHIGKHTGAAITSIVEIAGNNK